MDEAASVQAVRLPLWPIIGVAAILPEAAVTAARGIYAFVPNLDPCIVGMALLLGLALANIVGIGACGGVPDSFWFTDGPLVEKTGV